ncbi:MAG: hypothetical protein LWY06_10315 [Firmicutes bacterium]|nr:hypothetical protein [Bacillota bacterium]
MEKDIVDISGVEGNDLMDLFAHVLIRGIEHLKRRGMDRGYRPVMESASLIRGKIDFNESIRCMEHIKGRLFCRYDDLSYNILHNQILKATLTNLINNESISNKNREELISTRSLFRSVDDIRLHSRIFSMVQLHSNNWFYDFLIKICKLIYDSIMPDETAGRFKFRNILENEVVMHNVFERFVRNFYYYEQKEYRVKRENLKWDLTSDDETSMSYLPNMQTDITLESPERKIIIDTKYYKDMYRTHYEKKSINQNHMNQITSYLNNTAASGAEKDLNCAGILLYPAINDHANHNYKYQNHRILIQTIDLTDEWRNIHDNLLEIIKKI